MKMILTRAIYMAKMMILIAIVKIIIMIKLIYSRRIKF